MGKHPIIDVDAKSWETAVDACEGLRRALSAVAEHGNSVDAFIDSMIWGGMLGVEPPYQVAVRNLGSNAAREFVGDLAILIEQARRERLARDGANIEVSIIIA